MTRTAAAPATRSTLLRQVRRLEQVRKGAALLKRKRQALVNELFARARTALTSREAIEAQARRAWISISRARAFLGTDQLAPLGWPTRAIGIDLATVELWGLHVATLIERPTVVRSFAARGVMTGSGEAASQEAAREFEILIEQLIEAAPREHMMRRLGHALARTTRLVNTLEQRTAVRLNAEVIEIRRTLEEREREEHLRTKRLIRRRKATRVP